MAERRPKVRSLGRTLGAGELFSVAYGNIGGSIYYALGLVAAFALGLTPVIFAIAGVVFWLTAATYVEASITYPGAGGASAFARRAFGELTSFVAAWGQLLGQVAAAAIAAYFVPNYLSVVWAPLAEGPWNVVCGVAILCVLAAITIVGGRESSGARRALSLVDLATQGLLIVVGAALVLNPSTLVENVEFGSFAPTDGLLVALPLAVAAFAGIEALSNLAEETREPARTIPRAANRVVLAAVTVYVCLPVVALSALPVSGGSTELATTYAAKPVVGVVEQLGLGSFTEPVAVYVGLLAAAVLLAAANAGLIGVSRLSYAMGRYRQLPGPLGRLHHRFKTPFVAIALFGLVGVLLVLPGDADLLIRLYAFGVLLSYTLAHASLVRLRRKDPDAARPWRSPFNVRLRGASVPLAAIVGGLATALFWVITAAERTTLAVGLGWMLAGIAVYALQRRRSGLSLTETSEAEAPRSVVDHEVEYDSILVVFEDGQYSEEVMRTAVKMAARRSRGIHVLVPIVVPTSAPIDAALPAAEARAATTLERARVHGGRRVTGHCEKLRAGEAGRRIVTEAEQINARAIIFPLKRDPGGSLFSPAVQRVLSDRPCRVILTTEPAGAPVLKR
jgi:APA family basic amino acid/polyamine antiporter